MTPSNGLLGALARILLPRSRKTVRPRAGSASTSGVTGPQPPSPGQVSGSATIELAPKDVPQLRIDYDPATDGDPDAGEIVWTWVPYEENDGRGKDRPVLVIGRQSPERVYAVKLTSRSHDGERDFLTIGTGAWDSKGRESWVDVDQLYSVHVEGMRREAAALDLDQFTRVAQLLQRRYGWTVGK